MVCTRHRSERQWLTTPCQAELYERVINARWDAMYRGDHPRSYLKERYRIDTTTYDFIDGVGVR